MKKIRFLKEGRFRRKMWMVIAVTVVKVVTGDVEEGACSTVKVNTDGETGPLLKLVKLTKSGLLLFVFGKSVSPDVVGIVLRIVQSGESGSSASLLSLVQLV
uniref:uncharacterized protein LOC101314559 isoform X2 n=1 Tax=Fragaria vesca subsp. vesca TaxID=101020 RepID=UPI0005CB64FF|nr:PREDICTED: uncharacterized protein LOC101314559 isoform X2 [Fragaria vesca subsp. vesca]